jgi:hypothetical protein
MATQRSPLAPATVILANDERWQLVLRITASQQLAKAARLREILLYITRSWLLDETTSIHEQDIGCDVLGRREDFNPAEDNIVRVQIRQLRKKLELYFATEGSTEPIELQIPKGSYLPRFEKRSEKQPAVVLSLPSITPDLPPPENTTQTMPVSGEMPQDSHRNGLRRILLAVAVVLFALIAFSLGRFTHLQSHADTFVRKPGENPLLDRIFTSDLPVSIVVADTNLVILQNVLHTDISVNDYISKDYPANILRYASNPEERTLLERLALRNFTSLADVNVAMRCAELSREFGGKSTLRYTRYMNARDFERGNFILIGSRTADPWVALFEPRLNFAYEKDPVTQVFHFRNKHPLPGEQAIYIPGTEKDASTTSYVDIALVPNLSKTGYVLLLNAATMNANEAAMELIFRKKLPASFFKLIAPESGENPIDQSFEIFLRDRAIDGVVSGFDVIAVRKLSQSV